MTVKHHRARGGMNLFIKKEDKNETGNNADPDQAKYKYRLQL